MPEAVPSGREGSPPPARAPREPMNHLYRVSRAIIWLAMRIFFRRVAIRGSENIPRRGPVILAANHPGGLVDAFSIGLSTRRKVNFMARSTLFTSPSLARLLASLGGIPVYRRSDAVDEMGKNVEVFSHCYELLERGGVIGIFPEGITHTDPQVKHIKTGAVRIGLETETRNAFDLGVQVVPVGINFSEPGKFRSELILRVGEPIALKKYEVEYLAGSVETVRRVTEELHQRLEQLVIHLEDISKLPIVEEVEKLYLPDLIDDPSVLPAVDDRATREIEIKHRIAEAVEYYSKLQPARVLAMKQRIDAYKAALGRLHITDEMLRREVGTVPLLKETLPVAVIGVLGAPLALFGWIINVMPHRLTRFAATRLAKGVTQLAAWKMWIGFLAFSLFYGAAVLMLQRMYGFGWIGMLVAFTLLPVTGYLSSRYFGLLRHYRENIRLTYLHLRRGGQLHELRLRRSMLIRDTDRIRGAFF